MMSSAGSGTVILAAEGHPHVDVAIRLRAPISVRERLQFRKLLEISDHQLGLLVDGTTIYGLGAISEQYDGRTEDLFRYSIVEQGVWMMSHHNSPLLRVANGHPQLPRPRMSPSLFVDSMRRVFADIDDDDIQAIWRLTQTAVNEGKGTMLVVTTAAAQEAQRLAPQALAIDPQMIGSRMLRSLTRIDGAVLLTPDGTCHAVGVILDGIATGVGDPGRGARYNSAVRYTAASSAPCLIVIVSDDGMIDVHPELAPRVRPEDVEQALFDLERAPMEKPGLLSMEGIRAQLAHFLDFEAKERIVGFVVNPPTTQVRIAVKDSDADEKIDIKNAEE